MTAQPGGLLRSTYQDGQTLRAADLVRDQQYHITRLRQHTVLAHEPGILDGFGITAFPKGSSEPITEGELRDAQQPLDLFLESGSAVDGLGRFTAISRRLTIGPDFARTPTTLPAGLYRLELHYQHATAAATRSVDPCAVESSGSFGEGAKIRLRPSDDPVTSARPEDILDGNVDDPRLEAPVVLGHVLWDGTDYVAFDTLERDYVGVRAHRMISPDGTGSIGLEGGERSVMSVRTRTVDDDGNAELTEQLRIDSEGNSWARDGLSVGPAGLSFRVAEDLTDSDWQMGLQRFDDGADFRRDADGNDLGSDQYYPGTHEVRVEFQRDGNASGKRRVAVGHVPDGGGEFQPALVVYDRDPSVPGEGFGTVEILGDLYVRGTGWFNRAAKAPPPSGNAQGNVPQDELDALLRQLAGPLGPMLKTFLTSDPDYAADIAPAVSNALAASGNFVSNVGTAVAADTPFRTSVKTLIVNDSAFIDDVKAKVKTALLADTAFLQDVKDDVKARLVIDQGFINAVAAQIP